MKSMIMSGLPVKEHWVNILKEEVSAMYDKPILTIITVGDDPASKSYVKNKITTAADIGIDINHISMSEDTTQEQILLQINDIAFNNKTDGLIVQLPIRSIHKIDEREVLNHIPKKMDVDCLGDLMYADFICGKEGAVPPCTSQGVMDLLDYYKVPLEGKEVLMIGRSRLVGKGLAELLGRRNATVTLAHSKSNLLNASKDKELIISAVGVKNVVGNLHCALANKDCAFVNVGLTRDEDGKLCGDIDINNFYKEVNGTPYSVGGVGPLTVVNLMKNTINLAKLNGRK